MTADKSRQVQRNVTLVDIARLLDISPMTVSRALNSHPSVSDETRRKVLRKAKELNYRPNLSARSLVTRKSGVIGLVVPDISHSFYAEVTLGIQRIIEEKGYALILSSSHRDVKTEIREIDAMMSGQVEGLIVASTLPEDSCDYFANLQRMRVPFVLIDRYFRRLSCSRLTTDDFEVGRIATEHLVSLGHRNIVHLCGKGTSVGRLREEGYRHALEAHGLRAENAWIVPGNFQIEDSRQAVRLLFHLDTRPTAIFGASDYSAFGALAECRELGLQVPRDVSVIGAGDIEGSSNPCAFLTTVRWEREALGREAARLLLDRIAGPVGTRPATIIFPPALVVRQSTGPPRNA